MYVLTNIFSSQVLDSIVNIISCSKITAIPRFSCNIFCIFNIAQQTRYVDSVFVFYPLRPHDALKHHLTSLKTHLIFLQLGVFE